MVKKKEAKDEQDVKPVIKFPPIVKARFNFTKPKTGKVEIKQDKEGGNVTLNKPTYEGHVNIKVKGQDGSEVFFTIKRSMSLKKLMNTYCDQRGVEYNALVFLYDGRRLRESDTPGGLKMEADDEIDAMLHQTGGTDI